MSANPRMQILEEMMQVFVQSVSAERVAGYYKHLKDIPEDSLRAACAGAVESGQQRGIPSVADLRRRAGELGARRLGELEPADVIPLHPECKRTVHETPHGPLLCCREEGHAGGSCEPWFDAGGARPEDAEIIFKLTGRRDNVVPLQEPDFEEPVL